MSVLSYGPWQPLPLSHILIPPLPLPLSHILIPPLPLSHILIPPLPLSHILIPPLPLSHILIFLARVVEGPIAVPEHVWPHRAVESGAVEPYGNALCCLPCLAGLVVGAGAREALMKPAA